MKKNRKELIERVKQHMEEEKKKTGAGPLADIILGGQDGLVNVLGIVLGVASATSDRFIVLIAGLVATFAESVSMAAVAYASTRAEQDHYKKELEQEKWEIENLPEIEREEIKLIYMKKGYSGKELEKVVRNITSNKDLWLSVMMNEELGLAPLESYNPIQNAAIVGVSAIIGSLIPLIPFLFLEVNTAIIFSLIISALTLFFVGAYKAKITVGNWIKSGLEMMMVGIVAALIGWIVGKLAGEYFGVSVY